MPEEVEVLRSARAVTHTPLSQTPARRIHPTPTGEEPDALDALSTPCARPEGTT